MADLFTMMGAAARAMDAQRYALDVTGQNIANVNTPGFARRTIQFGEVPPRDAWSAGGGVDVVAVQAARAPLLDARLRYEQPAGAREGAIAQQLETIQAAIGVPGESLDAALTRFYTTYASLAEAPTSTTARQQVITEGQTLTASFRSMSTALSDATRSADREIRQTVNDVNAIADRIARINGSIADPAAAKAALGDEQAAALSALTDLIDVNVITHEDGSVDVTVGNGRALVVGTTTYDLQASSTPPSGFAQILTDGAAVTTNVTGEITAGRLGGLLQVRDVLVPGYTTRLDNLAYSVATDVNTLTTSGYDVAGTAGLAFFVPPSAIAGAAVALAINPTVAADNRLVVAAGTPAAGDNTVARAIAVLGDTAMTGTNTRPVDAWSQFVFSIASDARSAALARDSHDEVSQQLKNLRDQVTGVSIDEEAAMLMRFQRAYEANARFFQVADQTLELLMQMVGR